MLARLLMAGRVSLLDRLRRDADRDGGRHPSSAPSPAIYGGVVGAVLMRLVDAMLCFPTVFLLLALAALIEPGVAMTTVIIAATAWMEVARIVEDQIRSLRERDFAVAALDVGASDLRDHVPRAGPQRDRRRSWSPPR